MKSKIFTFALSIVLVVTNTHVAAAQSQDIKKIRVQILQMQQSITQRENAALGLQANLDKMRNELNDFDRIKRNKQLGLTAGTIVGLTVSILLFRSVSKSGRGSVDHLVDGLFKVLPATALFIGGLASGGGLVYVSLDTAEKLGQRINDAQASLDEVMAKVQQDKAELCGLKTQIGEACQ